MPILIDDKYTTIKIVLTTTESNKSSIKLRTYINDSTDVYKTYNPSVSGNNLTYTINTKDYSIDDVISKMELIQTGSTQLWQTHEGITWLVDGEEYSTKNTASETFKFDNEGTHTIEAVYTGNDSLEMASTGKQPIIVTQPAIQETGSLDNDGSYLIEFVDKNLKSMTYNDGTMVNFRLTKGGVLVPTSAHRNIEIVTPTSVLSPDIVDGIAGFKNTGYSAGTYTIKAYYQNENSHEVTSTSRKITINKGQPSFSDNYSDGGDFIPSSRYKLTLRYNGNAIANTKITLYVNGKAKTLTTNSSGVAYHDFKNTGTYKFKAVYKGNTNLKQAELSRTITVVRSNG